MDSEAADRHERSVVLVVDDQPENLKVLGQLLRSEGCRVLAATQGEEALALTRKLRPDLILLDVNMPGVNGYQVCERLKLREDMREVPVIFLTARTEPESVVRGFEAGAVDYVTKPFNAHELRARVRTQLELQRRRAELTRRTEELEHELAVAKAARAEAEYRVQGPLLGHSAAVEELRRALAERARSEAPVLLSCPPGAGAEAAARTLHAQSARSERAFLSVDCAHLRGSSPDDSSGSLTPGDEGELSRAFALARGGTLFLQGVELLPETLREELHLLLHAQDAANAARVWVIASAARGVSEALAKEDQGAFAHFGEPVAIPALSERVDDIPELAAHYLHRHGRRLGRPPQRLSSGAMVLISTRRWHGNVSELRSVIERAALKADRPLVRAEDLSFEEGVSFGSYRLEERLATGGMGEVWRARHRLLARPAALKLIRESKGSANPVMLQRFEREARATARLVSPHTVRMYDFGISDRGEYYYVMELLQGLDLRNLVDACGPLAPARAVALLQQACRSLAEAHGEGLIHRDIKPENLMICRMGVDYDVLKVLDFGLVKDSLNLAEADSEATDGFALPPPGEPLVTGGGLVVGTPGYVAPEVFSSGGGAPDFRVDLYALGCVAYWMLTGSPVFPGTDPAELFRQHKLDEPPPPSAASARPIPAELDRIVLACLAKDPARRPASAMDLERQLGEVGFAQPWTQELAREWWELRPHLLASAQSDALLNLASKGSGVPETQIRSY